MAALSGNKRSYFNCDINCISSIFSICDVYSYKFAKYEHLQLYFCELCNAAVSIEKNVCIQYVVFEDLVTYNSNHSNVHICIRLFWKDNTQPIKTDLLVQI